MPIQLDAKLNAFRRSSKGFYITLEIGPDSDWTELAHAPLGQAFGVAMVAYDAETGSKLGPVINASPGPAAREEVAVSVSAGQLRGQAGKPQTDIDAVNDAARRKRHWSEMSRAQQAGILSNDPTFGLWLSNTYPNTDAEDTAEAIRRLCGVHSRSELSEDRVAGKKWDQLVANFHAATGRLAEQRG